MARRVPRVPQVRINLPIPMQHRAVMSVQTVIQQGQDQPVHVQIPVHRGRPVRRGLMHVQTVPVMRDMAVMQQRVRVRYVHVDITRAVQETLHVPRHPQDTMQPGRVIQVRPSPVPIIMPPQVHVHRRRVQRIHPVRRGLMHVQTVHVMRDMAVMQQRVRVQSVQRDTINPVQAIHHVQTVVRGITVPVVRHVRRVRRVHTVQRPT